MGELGQGKSLLADRLLQRAIRNATQDATVPIPVFLGPPWTATRAEQVFLDLRTAIETQARGRGVLEQQGATVVIDGIDQAGGEWVGRCVDQAYALRKAWPQTTFTITSRPTPVLRDEPAVRMLPELADDELLLLLHRFGCDVDRNELENLTPSLRHAIKRPLFAILFALHRGNRAAFYSRSAIGELLADLVEKSLSLTQASISSVRPLLRRLAVRAIDYGGAVPRREGGPPEFLQPLLECGLVVEHPQQAEVEFSLPILAEYFAAESLTFRDPPIDSLAGDLERLERWWYPLTMLLATADTETVYRILAPLAAGHPAYASELLDWSVGRYEHFATAHAMPPISECGELIREAMKSWVAGMGVRLANRVGPVDATGELRPLGITRRDSGGLAISWYHGSEQLSADVVELPTIVADLFARHATDDERRSWPGLWFTQPRNDPTWAWYWTRNQLGQQLKEQLNYRELTGDLGPLMTEWVWERAVKIANNYSGSIGLDDLMRRLNQLAAPFPSLAHVTFSVNTVRLSGDDFERLRSHVALLQASGASQLEAPYPGPDRRGSGWVWTGYSDAQLLKRTVAVLDAGLKAYIRLTETWFRPLAPRMQLYAALPGRLLGQLWPQTSSPGTDHPPVLRWYIQALPQWVQSRVEVTLNSGPSEDWYDVLHHEWGRLRQARPRSASWIQPSGGDGALEVFGLSPATELAYNWLGHDLHRLGWLDSSLGGPHQRM